MAARVLVRAGVGIAIRGDLGCGKGGALELLLLAALTHFTGRLKDMNAYH